MYEVSGAAMRAMVDLGGSSGTLTPAEIFAGMPFDARSLRRLSHVAWDDYCTLFDRLEAGAGGVDALVELVARSYHQVIPRELQAIFGALVSPRLLYRVIVEVVDKPMFPSFRFSYAELEDGRLRVGGYIPRGARPCLAFNRVNVGAMRGATRHLGLPEAEVEVEFIDGHDLVVLVDPPASQTLFAKAERASIPALRQASLWALGLYAGEAKARSDRVAELHTDVGTLGRELTRHLDLTAMAEALASTLEQLGWRRIVLQVVPLAGGPAEALVRHGDGGVDHVLPLASGGRELGTLEVGGRGDLELLAELTPWISLAVDNARTVTSLSRARPSGDGPSLEIRADEARRTFGLTPRQAEVFQRLVQGLSNKEIAADLGCAENTVELHVTQVFKKAGVQARTELIARFWARSLG